MQERSLQAAMQSGDIVKKITVDNKGGAGGTIGIAQFVNSSKGDPNALMKKSPEELDAALAEAVRASIADGAKAVIIGGGPLTASALRLQPQFDIPLVVPVIAAANAAARKVQEGK